MLAIGLATLSSTAGAQTAGTSTFLVFVRTTPIGSEQVATERTAQGWTISSSGRLGAPVDLVLRSFTATTLVGGDFLL